MMFISKSLFNGISCKQFCVGKLEEHKKFDETQCKTPSQSPAGAVYLVRPVLKRRFVNVR